MSLEYRSEEVEQQNVEESPESLRAVRRVAYYSYILIGAIVAVYLAQVYFNNRFPLEPELARSGLSASTLVAGFNSTLVMQGQLWRLLTSAAVHGSVVHLGFNAYAIYVLGRQFEMLSARAHLAIVFILSALGGSVPGLILHSEIFSVGASGGIVGFLGYLAVYGWRRRALIPDSFRQNMIFNIGLMLFFGLATNASGGGMRIDNLAHIGGLVTGAAYGFLQIPRDLYKDSREASGTANVAGIISLVIYLITCASLIGWLLTR